MNYNYVTDSQFARAGGGGSHGGGHGSSGGHSSHSSSSSGGHNSSSGSSFLVPMLLMFGLVALFVLLGTIKQKRLTKTKNAEEKAKLAAASYTDVNWQETALQARVNELFQMFEADWCTKNIESMRSYLTSSYFSHMQLVLLAMKNLGRTNKMENVTLLSTNIANVDNQADNSQDSFIVEITAKANDALVDDKSGEILYQDSDTFTEYWHFCRHENKWLLGGISQASEDAGALSDELQNFAHNNGFYYSPDWGWLLLPQKGQLFSHSSFMNSDINNHVIGFYHDLLVQFYSYIPNRTFNYEYTIAQAILPKNYGNIVVRRVKSKVFRGKIKGLTKVETEWADFNKKYEVFASDMERVTSFELLNPVYMEKLESLPYEVSIEVVDNVVYLFTTDNKASFDDMLVVLKSAFEEMKL